MRLYNNKIDKEFGWLMTFEEFYAYSEDGSLSNDDGNGYWVKNNFASNDEVFNSRQEDATHVVWYNK
jgi:hypothetical protein